MNVLKYGLMTLSSVVGVLLQLFPFTAVAGTQSQPNVLMVVIDDLADYPLAPKFNGVKKTKVPAL